MGINQTHTEDEIVFEPITNYKILNCLYGISPFKIFRDVIEARMEEIRAANQQLGITACERSDAEESAAEGMADPVSSPGRINEREPSPYYSRSHRNRARSRSQDRRSR